MSKMHGVSVEKKDASVSRKPYASFMFINFNEVERELSLFEMMIAVTKG